MFLSVSLGIPFHEVRQWSSAEILLYQCYYRINPWGVERDDIRAANQSNFIAAATGVKKQGGGGFTIQDFMPFSEKAEEEGESGGKDTPGMRARFMSLMRNK